MWEKYKINFYTIGIAIILIFSFIIRAYNLAENPAGFFADEASTGIDAYSILRTGTDRHGEFSPLFFKGFNFDNVSPYQVYLTMPFVALFGINEQAIRLTPVFFSIVELFFFYLLLKELLPKPFALIGTLLLSLSPWHFHISRINMGDYYSWTLLTLLSYLFLIYGFKKGKTYFFLISALFFALTTYSYTPARLTTPLVFGLTIFTVLINKYLKIALLMVLVYITILIPFIYFHVTDPHSLQRLKDTAGIDLKNQTMTKQNTKDVSGLFLNKYLSHYSDLFLFQKGDADYPGQFIRRHSIPSLGLLYPYQKVLVLVGAIWIILKIIRYKKYELLFIIYLLFIFPIADSLTSDRTPFATRSYLGVLPFHLLIIFGINGVYQIVSKIQIAKIHFVKILVIIFSISLVIFSALTLIKHFNEAPKTTSDFWGWQYGPREIMKYFLTVKDKYDELYMSGEFNAGHIFISFYDPKNTCGSKCKMGDFFREPQIYNPSKRQLFSLSPDYLSKSNFVKDFLIKKTIYYPNGTIAFQIGKIVK